MRTEETDQMGWNLSEDFCDTLETAREFMESFEDLIGEVRVENYKGRTYTSANILDDGKIYTVYHWSDRPLEIFVKL